MKPSERKERHRSARPLVRVNMAISADGKIAFNNGRFTPFGTRRDRELLLQLRATADAVLSGANTVGPYPVTLGPGPARFRRLRVARGLAEYNLRVVVSGRARLSPRAKIFRHDFSPIVVLTTERAPAARRRALEHAGAHVELCGRDEIDFEAALRRLRRRWGVRSLVCEGGGAVNDALVAAGLVDELYLTLCPWIFGGRRAPTIAEGKGRENLADAAAFVLQSARRLGNELYLIYRPKPKRPGTPPGS